MNGHLFRGALVRLAAPGLESAAQALARWSLDSEFGRLFASGPVRPMPAEAARKDLEAALESQNVFTFFLRALDDDRLIGLADLEVSWPHGDAWLSIGLGEREVWGKGCGSDALRVLLRYAFAELNLARVSLTVFDDNTRARRAYRKLGFVIEGCARQAMQRDGIRRDLIYMGLLREEWEVRDSGISQQRLLITDH